MAYINWFSIEELYAGTTLKDQNHLLDNSMALHTTEQVDAIIANRNNLMNELNFELNNCVFANQTHSSSIHKVTKQDIGAGAFNIENAIDNCDALYTKEKNILLGVFSADCVPILIYDREQHIIAAIHAGWKGTTQQITKKMLDILLYDENCDVNELYVYIGPAIEFLNFEVDQDVVDEIKKLPFNSECFIIPKDNGKFLVDLKGINYQILLNAKIPDTHIFVHHGDTYEDEENFFSYRKRKENGRNMTFILQK